MKMLVKSLMIGALIIVSSQFMTLSKAGAVTIFIDGMSTPATIASPLVPTKGHYREPYLINSPLANELKQKDPMQTFVGWSGNPAKNEEVRESINLLKGNIEKLQQTHKGEPINIVSHSYGTVIAYRALEELQSERPHIKINSLTTMGSPLGHQPETAISSITEKIGVIGAIKETTAQILKQLLPEPKPLSNVNDWRNLWADFDNISGQIKVEGVKNIQIDKDKDAIEREAIKETVIIPSTTAGSTSAIAMKPRIKSVDVWHRAYYEGVHIGEINWDIPKDFVAGITPTLVKGWKEKAADTIETIKEKANEFLKKQLVSYLLTEALSLPALPVKIGVGLAWPKTVYAPSDPSQLALRNAQQQLNPTKVEFTQTFDGLFTQAADFVGSRDGSHSGSLTDGTRVNVIGDSRPGDFTGSFSGQTVAETGYTPAMLTNSAFSGTSVGTASAKGFKEGDLKGTMTVTVPAGTQTATVSGNITIKTDGSLSMPSYTGPVTVNATGEKVGTMSGEWSQSKTR